MKMTGTAMPPTAVELDALLQVLETTPGFVRNIMRRIPKNRWTTRPANGNFSLVEHLCHLRDIESEGYVVRLQRILAEDDPELLDIDGGKLAIERDYQEQDAADALEAFVEARAKSVAILADAEDGHFERKAHFAGQEQIPMSCIAAMMRSHDEEHRKEMQQLASELNPA
jgi:hypothetical protein